MAEVLVSVVTGDEVDERAVSDRAELEAAVDADIAAFDAYFQKKLNNDPLLASEKAMLKTYLWFKTHTEKHDAG